MNRSYRLFGARHLEKVKVMYLCSSISESCIKQAKRISRGAGIRAFICASPGKGFWRVFERASPKVVVPLDGSAYRTFGRPLFEHEGLMYYKIKGYSAVLSPGSCSSDISEKLRALVRMKKSTFNRRAELLSVILSARDREI